MKNDLQSAIWTFLLFGYDQLISSLVKLIILDKEIFSASHRKSFIYSSDIKFCYNYEYKIMFRSETIILL